MDPLEIEKRTVEKLEADLLDLADRLETIQRERDALVEGLRNLVADYEEIGGPDFYDDSFRIAKALLTGDQILIEATIKEIEND